MKKKKLLKKQLLNISADSFKQRWAGYATTKIPYEMHKSFGVPYYEFIQRNGEKSDEYEYISFLCTSDRNEIEDMALNFPDRWHIEQFFNNYQALGWKRTGTMNLNIQYGRMTMPLFAQAAIHMMRQWLGPPINTWEPNILQKIFLKGIEGDIRTKDNTIIVTFYNASNLESLKSHYENLPAKLQAEGIAPNVPWLYDFKIDFRFK